VAHRYGFAVGNAEGPADSLETLFGAVVKDDLGTGRRDVWQAPAGHLLGEAVPVVKADAGAREDALWLLTVAYDPAVHRSRLVILDGEGVGDGPVAEVHLPFHVPLGFHGNFSPG
ncbi:MAG: carotenoid oxygenase family protein, partial [Candidatus Sericytochromatia bacterium]|nr:carotenoid oxygenase family protein [Candidatus Sericytochromatia bacterium]